jgi:hypothetical protein
MTKLSVATNWHSKETPKENGYYIGVIDGTLRMLYWWNNMWNILDIPCLPFAYPQDVDVWISISDLQESLETAIDTLLLKKAQKSSTEFVSLEEL